MTTHVYGYQPATATYPGNCPCVACRVQRARLAASATTVKKAQGRDHAPTSDDGRPGAAGDRSRK